jgi:hypothetical protein
MADQADNLRQLVRARREWRQLVVEERSAPVSSQRFMWARLLASAKKEKAGRPSFGAQNVSFWVAQAARWALGRVVR